MSKTTPIKASDTLVVETIRHCSELLTIGVFDCSIEALNDRIRHPWTPTAASQHHLIKERDFITGLLIDLALAMSNELAQ